MESSVDNNSSLDNSFINVIVTDVGTGNPLQDVVGVIMLDGEIVGKGLSNENGQLDIDFDAPLNSELTFILTKGNIIKSLIQLVLILTVVMILSRMIII